MGGLTDFIVNWNGRCFFCEQQISSQFSQEELTVDPLTQPFPSYSLQCLSRYVKIDMRKVFTNDGPIPTHLLAKVQKSKLKVELCSECASINDKFSGLFQQLEKLEMDVRSWLGLVLDKLAKDRKTQKVEESGVLTDSDSLSGGKLQIVNSLRNETIQKCCKKLNNSLPKVRTQNMTKKEVNGVKRKLKCRSKKEVDMSTPENISKIPRSSMAESDIKNESTFEHSLTDVDEIGTLGDFDEPQSAPTDEDDGEGLSNISTATYDADDVEFGDGEDIKIEKVSSLATLPTTGSSSVWGKYHVDNGTGKHKCKDCLKEFSNYHRFYFHYQTKHLKVSYKCSVCEQKFTQIGNFNRHQKIYHKRVTYKCQVCNQVFTLESNLMKHRRPNGCAASETFEMPTLEIVRPPIHGKIQDFCSLDPKTGRVICSLCSSHFANKDCFRHHHRSVHRQVRYKCTLCQKEFKYRNYYFKHHKTDHVNCPPVK